MIMSDDLVLLFEGYATALEIGPSTKELFEMRKHLDSTVLEANFRHALRTLNDQEKLRDAASACRRVAQDLRVKRADTLDIVRIGVIGGGAGLSTGAIVTALALTVPALALIPIVGGVFMVLRGRAASQQLAEEIGLLDNIAERIDVLLKV